mmetsp:Transcript_458/g.280  ORF Transcript_458/g.280 Transcript_458/m.280 type:complete len:129 (+) Transcript_458:98-484(+)
MSNSITDFKLAGPQTITLALPYTTADSKEPKSRSVARNAKGAVTTQPLNPDFNMGSVFVSKEDALSAIMKSEEGSNVRMAENIQKNKFLTVKDNEDLKKHVKVKRTLNDTFWSEFNDTNKPYRAFIKN